MAHLPLAYFVGPQEQMSDSEQNWCVSSSHLSPACPHTTTLFATPAVCMLYLSPRGRVMIRGCVSTRGRLVTERGARKVLRVKAAGSDVVSSSGLVSSLRLPNKSRQMIHYLPRLWQVCWFGFFKRTCG